MSAKIITKRHIVFLSLVLAFLVLMSTEARAAIYPWAGTSPAPASTPISVQADVDISGDTMTITLSNLSSTSIYQTDILTSFYFDVYNGSTRPTLTYDHEADSSGDVYSVYTGAIDILKGDLSDQEGQNNEAQWLLQAMDPTKTPYLGFGIGTVGNSSLENNFPAMDGIDSGIAYNGEITTGNSSLNDTELVRGSATFTIHGLSGYTMADFDGVAFGFGTGPELLTPLPGAVLLLSLIHISEPTRPY